MTHSSAVQEVRVFNVALKNSTLAGKRAFGGGAVGGIGLMRQIHLFWDYPQP